MKQHGFMLMDMLLGIALLVILGTVFARLSFEFEHDSHLLMMTRHRIRAEDVAAFEVMGNPAHDAASKGPWRVTAVPAVRRGGAILPAGCHWVAVGSAREKNLEPLFALQVKRPKISTEVRP